MKAHTRKSQSEVTPAMALEYLKEGNQRFVSNLQVNRDLLQQVNETADGQFPFAVILSCIDSRTSAELIFDQGLGDIFSARVAGNVVNEDILGSMEYSCKVAGSKLVLVIGHTKCGAITAACNRVKLGNITKLLGKVGPAIEMVEKDVSDIRSEEAIKQVTIENVRVSIKNIRNNSEILAQLEKEGEIKITGGIYDVESGEVEFFE
ncbi:MAG: carbonic anhydrase family protein [Brumimicrobium sp.]|nr:carbonic anhydrase family protein [Brumimicrobium sp.]